MPSSGWYAMCYLQLRMKVLTLIEWLCAVPIFVGSWYGVACFLSAVRCRAELKRSSATPACWPSVTVLKPVHGLEKDLEANLRSTIRQDYPDFQVVLSVQRRDDPALPLLRTLEREFGADRVTVAVEECRAGSNGKINNLLGGLIHARHDVLVISDSDIRVRPDYLKTIVAPLADPDVGFVCTLYKAIGGGRWFEKLELLTMNAEFLPNFVFARVTGTAGFCLGASTALHRRTLEAIGGLESLADYLVEDFEMGRRIAAAGKKPVILPYLVETVVDLKTASQWWSHQVYWDQNNRAARPGAFLSTVVIKPVPFAVLFAILQLGDTVGLSVLAATLAVRMLTTAGMMHLYSADREGLHSLPWLPIRDIAALLSWVLALMKKTTMWRGKIFVLTRDGRLVAEQELSA